MNTKTLVFGSALIALASLVGCSDNRSSGADVKSEPTQAQPKPTDKAEAKPAETRGAEAKPAETKGAEAKPAEAKPTAGGTALAAPGAGREAPEVSEGRSAPPTVEEWNAATDANTAGANSAPKDCELKVVREWLKVNCRGKIKEVTNMDGFGQKGLDYYELVTPGKVVDWVVRMKRGHAIKARILREDQSASLFVNWPQQSEKPSIIALQIFKG